MRRTLIGSMFGQPGMYVSQPGDDLDNPQKNLLLDSRFGALEIHHAGVWPLTRDGPINNTYSFSGTAPYPSLGYIPIAYVGFIDTGSDVVSYPPSILDINGRATSSPQLIVRLSEIFVSFQIGGGQGATAASFSYVIFRNPA